MVATRQPKPSTIWAVALAGCAAAATSFGFVLMSDAVSGDVGEPLVIAVLSSWITRLLRSLRSGRLVAPPCEPFRAAHE
jgi:hypothetical protein